MFSRKVCEEPFHLVCVVIINKITISIYSIQTRQICPIIIWQRHMPLPLSSKLCIFMRVLYWGFDCACEQAHLREIEEKREDEERGRKESFPYLLLFASLLQFLHK